MDPSCATERQAGPVVGFDADRGVEGEAAGVFPGEHLAGGVLLEPSVPVEPAEDPAADGFPEGLDVGPGEGRGLVEADAGRGRVLPLSVLDLFEDAVQDAEMVMEVGIEARAESVEEGLPGYPIAALHSF